MKETGIQAVDQYAGGLVPVYSLRCKREEERGKGWRGKRREEEGGRRRKLFLSHAQSPSLHNALLLTPATQTKRAHSADKKIHLLYDIYFSSPFSVSLFV